jgi:hypothetical protein
MRAQRVMLREYCYVELVVGFCSGDSCPQAGQACSDDYHVMSDSFHEFSPFRESNPILQRMLYSFSSACNEKMLILDETD